MLAHLRERWFLLALIGVLVVGMTWPEMVGPIARRLPREAIVAPPLGWLASQVLPVELAVGVVVAVVVPSTLAASTVFTRRAGGNDAATVLVTVITNLGCFLVAPLWLRILVGERGAESGEIDYTSLMLQLAGLVVAPIAVAQIARRWQSVKDWSGRHKARLGELAQVGILGMVLVGAVGGGERLQELGDSSALVAADIGLMIVVVLAIHLVLLFAGYYLAILLRMNHADAIAVGISGSQKTIMVGLYVALAFSPLAILPMVAYHAGQLVVDTLVTDWWRRQAPHDRQ
jgi:solute carrier family 10 (sodium/bile acid cotransporter), member 7